MDVAIFSMIVKERVFGLALAMRKPERTFEGIRIHEGDAYQTQLDFFTHMT